MGGGDWFDCACGDHEEEDEFSDGSGPEDHWDSIFQGASLGPRSQQFGSLPVKPIHAMTQQATRHARRVYVGGLPPSANEQSVATFFNRAMAAIGGNTAGPGDAVVNVYINHEKKFAFVEMRSVEEASNAMALDGIIFEGAPVRVRRPSDYNPSLAATLGPSQPSAHLNLAAVRLSPGSSGGLEGPDLVFVGGLPYYFTEPQVRELLESFGALRGFELVRDRETGNSTGCAYCVYQDVAVTDIACAALNGIKMGSKTLTVRHANQGCSTQPRPEQESVLPLAQLGIAMQTLGLHPPATKVVCPTKVVSMDEQRGRDRDEDDIHRSSNYDRQRDNDREREDRPRLCSKSPSRVRSRHRSKSRSRSSSESRSKSKRVSGFYPQKKRVSRFDIAPPASAMAAAVAATTGQIPGSAPPIPGMFPNMFLTPNGQFGSLPVLPMQAMTQQATRFARRVYVGGLPPSANEQSVATFFNRVMAAIGGNTYGPGDAVLDVYINDEKKFAFVEMRSVEEASNAMALDGIIFEGEPIRIRRPSDYNPSLAATLGPSQPSAHLNLAAVELSPGSSGGLEGPDLVFVGGLPYYFTEPQVRELLESFGALRGFDLVRDRETGNSTGCAYCVYQDVAVTDIACAALNGIKMGYTTLIVRRANQGCSTQPRPEQERVQIAMQRLSLNPPATKVVCLTEVASMDELRDDDEFEAILEDMRTESSKFGTLVNVVIPRPQLDGTVSPGVGKVFLEYADVDGARNARAGMNGRKFSGDEVVAVFYPEGKYYTGEYDG